MKNKAKPINCCHDPFNVMHKRKDKSIMLFHRTFQLAEEAKRIMTKKVVHKSPTFKPAARLPSLKEKISTQWQRCRPEGYKLRMLPLMMLLLPLMAFQSARTGMLIGTVFSEEHRPFPNALIVIENGKRGTNTDSNGFFSLIRWSKANI
jgi:hypothetical protein